MGSKSEVRPMAVADAVLAASRVLVAVAARSLADVGEEITLPQYRALVVLAASGPQRAGDLAEALAVSSSTATRLCDRLLRKGLIFRERAEVGVDRRMVRVGLSDEGALFVEGVTRKRRAEIRRIVERVPPGERADLVACFESFARAAGEVPDAEWPGRFTL